MGVNAKCCEQFLMLDLLSTYTLRHLNTIVQRDEDSWQVFTFILRHCDQARKGILLESEGNEETPSTS
jgi:uncharacterized protein (DUF2336 family)